jgi:adenylate kinase
LDGFPRTPAQADALQSLLEKRGSEVTLVPYITAPEETLVERLSGRWTCRAQGHVYHIKFNPPKTPGICDIDGSELYQREDDKPETVKRRIQVYLEQTAPLIAYYRERGKLVEIDGSQPIEKVTEDLLAALEK